MRIRIELGLSQATAGGEWTDDWRVIDADCEPCDYNNYGVLASGASDALDAIWCAIEFGWLVPGRG